MTVLHPPNPPTPFLARLRRAGGPGAARHTGGGGAAHPPQKAAPSARRPAPVIAIGLARSGGGGAPVAAEPAPLSVRVRRAFLALPPTEVERRVLVALAENPGRGSVWLSRVCGWHGAIWHTHLAAICHRRMAWLFAPADSVCPETDDPHYFLHGALARYDPRTASFTMREEAEIALRGLGIIPGAGH